MFSAYENALKTYVKVRLLVPMCVLLRLGSVAWPSRQERCLWASHTTTPIRIAKLKCFQCICNLSVILNFHIGQFFLKKDLFILTFKIFK